MIEKSCLELLKTGFRKRFLLENYNPSCKIKEHRIIRAVKQQLPASQSLIRKAIETKFFDVIGCWWNEFCKSAPEKNVSLLYFCFCFACKKQTNNITTDWDWTMSFHDHDRYKDLAELKRIDSSATYSREEKIVKLKKYFFEDKNIPLPDYLSMENLPCYRVFYYHIKCDLIPMIHDKLKLSEVVPNKTGSILLLFIIFFGNFINYFPQQNVQN